MAKPGPNNPLLHLRASDLRAIAQLATLATQGVARLVEGVHQSVWGTVGQKGGPAAGQTGGLTGLVYKGVQSATRLVGRGLSATFAKLEPLLETAIGSPPETPQREAVLAALNGVMGDRLAASHNPLATPMSLRRGGQALDWQALPPVGPRVLLLLHGLCMNDLQWQTPPPQVHDHGEFLASALGYTAVYLRYNSGLHTSENAHLLSAQLKQLEARWPVALQELCVVAHSMGGLVIRGAVHYARQAGERWPEHVKSVVFLGTPHHGAPLERAGNWVDVVLGSTPYTRPFAKLGQLRSAGITDLRYGHVLDIDWQGHDRFRRKPDNREILPLPERIACFTIAATVAPKRGTLADRLIGDGLVPLPSALGQHEDPRRVLQFEKSAQWIAYRTSHMALLSSPQVAQQMAQWLQRGSVGPKV